MIHSLLGVCLICMGVGAKASTPINSYRHTEEKQERILLEEQEGTTFNKTIDISQYSNTYHYELTATQRPTIPNSDVAAFQKAFKTTWDNTNFDTMLVKGQVIDQNLVLYDYTNQTYGVAIPQVTNPTHETSSLIVMQITPYNYITESNFTIHMKINARFNNLQNPDFGTININARIMNSTLEGWQRYVDIQNYAPYCNNWLVLQDLVSGVYGTNYETQLRNIQYSLDNTYTSDYYDIQADINIDSSRTNYIVIYLEPTLTYPANINDPYYRLQGDAGDSVDWQNFFTGGSAYPGVAYRQLQINGRYIVPPTSYEVVDIPGLMWEILSMPFAFISTAFNLTLFPGTPYQVNISNLVLMVFGVLVFLFIFKLILRK